MDDSGPAAEASAPSAFADWPARAADAVDYVVAVIRDRAVRPIILLVRVVVFGAIITATAIVATILASVGLVRVLDLEAFGGRVWASDLVVGGFFVLCGLLLWSRRKTKGLTDRGSSGSRR